MQITVDEDVPLLRPIARDDRVRAEDVAEDGTADIAVLENDEDPDGTKSALAVTLGAGGSSARVLADGVVRVTLGDKPQLITYAVRDQDDQTAAAFIRVPSLTSLPPSLLSTTGVEVKSGETIELPLAEYVRAAGGKDVVITEAGKVSAGNSNGDSLVKDQTTLVYTSKDRYHGQDALTFEVTDGTGPDDPKGRKATLTIPITVLPPDNQPPTMVGASLSVAPGEDPSTLDLASLADDPDPGDKLSFSLIGGSPSGMSVSVSGSTLSASAEATTRKGTKASVVVRVTDGETEPVEATITVVVSASTRELASVNDDVIEEADQGATISVPVLTNDISPFPGEPLKLSSAIVETGSADARVNGTSVDVTSGADFVGTVVVRYRVLDATEDVDRAVEGRIRITVQGRPDAPGKPTVSSVQSRTVVMSWTPSSDNGTRITGYTVTSTAGNYTKQCASTTCTLDGLTNNVEYNFVVTATNRVGTSEPSVPSETARPDVRPETPAAPTLNFGDRSLQVAWTTPRTEGSPVESFTLEISPAPPSGVVQKTGVTGNSLVWDGLENGTAYQVRVQAVNRAPEPSGWSPWSATMVPARAPEAPGAPTTSRLEPVGSQAQIQVAWNEPANNGDAVSGYQLNVMQGSSVVRSIAVPAGQTSQAVVVDASETDYTFAVRAQNKAGWGEFSPPSAPRRGFTALGAPTMGAASAGNNQVSVTWTGGDRGGASASEVSYQYSVSGGGWRGDWVSGGNGSGVIGNGQVNNNGTYTIRIRAVATVDGATLRERPLRVVQPGRSVRSDRQPDGARDRERHDDHDELVLARPQRPRHHDRDPHRRRSRMAHGRRERQRELQRRLLDDPHDRRPHHRRGPDDDGLRLGHDADAAPQPHPRAWVYARQLGRRPATTSRQHGDFPAGNYNMSAGATAGGERAVQHRWEGPVYLARERPHASGVLLGLPRQAGLGRAERQEVRDPTGDAFSRRRPCPHPPEQGHERMSMTPEQAAWFRDTFTRLVDNVDIALMGKREVVGLVLAAMLAEGHVLLEDAPGTGKTSLAKALAASVQGTSNRIQFTPDLLPSDVTGVTIYDQQNHKFEFHRGPVFASIMLADEINRASPKTQSALLEVMEESRVTVDGVAHDVGRPFLVIATQNPIEQAGTYKLPEAQLDRFMIKTSIGYPYLAIAERILAGCRRPQPVRTAHARHHDRRRRRHGRPRGVRAHRPGRRPLHGAARRGHPRPPRRPASASPCAARSDDPDGEGLRRRAGSALRHPRRHQDARPAGLVAPSRARSGGRVLRRHGREASSSARSTTWRRRSRGPPPDDPHAGEGDTDAPRAPGLRRAADPSGGRARRPEAEETAPPLVTASRSPGCSSCGRMPQSSRRSPAARSARSPPSCARSAGSSWPPRWCCGSWRRRSGGWRS